MIALYEKQCPQALKKGHYQALNAYADKRLDKCVFGEENPPASSAPSTATSLQNVKR
jgi:hypothetical protein